MKIRIHIERLVLDHGTLAPAEGLRLQGAIAAALESRLSPESPARAAAGPEPLATGARPVARPDRVEHLSVQIARAVHSSLGSGLGTRIEGNHGGERKGGPKP
jgi:hypothetical protein